LSGGKDSRPRGRRRHQFGVQRERQILRGLAVVWRENRQTVKRTAAKRPPAPVRVILKSYYVLLKLLRCCTRFPVEFCSCV